MLIFVTAVTVALVVSFLCSICESVLLSVSPARAEALEKDGKTSGKLLKDFKTHIDVPIAAILIANTVAHTVGTAIAGATYGEVFDPSTIWIFTIVFTIVVLLLTEIIPKTLGVTYSRRLASPVAYVIRGFTILLLPFVIIAEKISVALRADTKEHVTSVEEIRLLAALGHREGALGKRIATMIMGATHLAKLKAQDIIVPRNQLVYFSDDHNRSDVIELIRQSGFSRYPFTPTGSLDDVSGVVLAKDLLVHISNDEAESIPWDDLVRDVLFVPDSKPLNSLLRTFQDSTNQIAVVVDEYGDMTGIVSLEDVLEEIVGDIFDESDQPVSGLWPQPDGSIHVRANVEMRGIIDMLDLPTLDETEFTSVGGFINEQLGRIPEIGDTVQYEGYDFEVLVASARRAERIAVRPRNSDLS